MAEIWKGAPVAAALTEELIRRREALETKGITPALAIVRAGDRGDDVAYERAAMKRCEKIGIAVRQFLLPVDCTQEDLIRVMHQVSEDRGIHGCLLFRPLPDKRMSEAVFRELDPRKDVDGMTHTSLASVFTGEGDGFPPCTAQACMEMLDYYGTDLTGKRAVVIGRSLVIGRPVAMMLQHRNATVTICHTRTQDIPSITRGADIVVASAGRVGLVGAEYVSPGQTVLDVGINVDEEGNLCGDVMFDEVEPVVAALTPVPAGIGSVTTAVLAKHVILAAERMSS